MIMVRILGKPRVELDGVAVDLPPRAIGILTRLALADGWLTRDQLLMDLWGDDVDSKKVRSLETLISKIRGVLSDRSVITFQAGAYSCASAGITIDLSELRSYASHAKEALNRDDPALSRIASLAGLELCKQPTAASGLGASRWLDELQGEILGLQTLLRAGLVADSHRPTGARYVVDNDRHLAYWTFGPQSDTDIVLLGGLSTHLEGMWDESNWSLWATTLAARHRVVIFDKRGTGLSDPIDEVPTIDDFASDTIQVLDAVGSKRSILVCCGEAGLFGPRVAVLEPDRVRGIVFINAIPKVFRSHAYEPGIPEHVATNFFQNVRQSWGNEAAGLELAAPSRSGDEQFVRWATRYQRLCATPGSLTKLAYFTRDVDARPDVEGISQEALILHSKHNRYFSPKNAEWLRNKIERSELVMLEGADHLYWLPEPERVVLRISQFVDDL